MSNDFSTTKPTDQHLQIRRALNEAAKAARLKINLTCDSMLVDDDGYGQRMEKVILPDDTLPLWIYPTVYRGEPSYIVGSRRDDFETLGVNRGHKTLSEAIISLLSGLVELRLKLQAEKTKHDRIVPIAIGDRIIAPEPNDSDCYNFSFVGTVIGFRNGYAQVEDGNGDVFDIEPDRLQLEED